MEVKLKISRCAEIPNMRVIEYHSIRKFTTAQGDSKESLEFEMRPIPGAVVGTIKRANGPKRKETAIVWLDPIIHLKGSGVADLSMKWVVR